MKKILLFVVGILITLPTFADYFWYTYEGQSLRYDETSGKVVKSGSLYGDLVIPSIAKNGDKEYLVTGIAKDAFVSSGLTSVTIPNSVFSIGEFAFYNCYYLESVILPSSLSSIYEATFYCCSSLSSVTIPNTVKRIEAFAFADCLSLTSVTIPDSVHTISEYAFGYCRNLTTVEIPCSVTNIENYAFSGCYKLTDVYYNSINPIKGVPHFFDDYTYSNGTLFVPAEAIEKCKVISPWKYFKNIKAFDFSGVDQITSDIDFSSPLEVYTLNGVHIADSIDSLVPGLYIVRQGNKSKKIAIK